MKFKRSERLVFMTQHLTTHPNQLIPLTYFVDKFTQAKSSISEDIRILKDVFENEEDDVMYVVLELLMGGDLLERILIKHDCNAHYTEFDAQQIMHQILLSLDYLHNERKIVHCDMKPGKLYASFVFFIHIHIYCTKRI